jgi:hypothetical protein
LTKRQDKALVVKGEYQLTPRVSGLRIETLDYHSKPRVVPWTELERIGIRQSSDPATSPPSSPDQRSDRSDMLGRVFAIVTSIDTKLEAIRELVGDLEDARSELADLMSSSRDEGATD